MIRAMPDQRRASTEPRAAGAVQPLLFDAVLHPHRSLGAPGFIVLMGGVAVIGCAAGAIFVVVGVWPVPGFIGLDVLLIYMAFRASYHSAQLTETLQLSQAELLVRRINPDGATQEWRFQPYWLRVSMDDPPCHGSRLVLASHGRQISIGGFLPVSERREVAEALRAALARQRDAA